MLRLMQLRFPSVDFATFLSGSAIDLRINSDNKVRLIVQCIMDDSRLAIG